MKSFQGKTAIVTGAGSGIGKELALALAGEGANVVITDIVKDRIDEVVMQLRSKGVKAGGYEVDHASKEQTKVFVDRYLGEWGHVDVLCCNAGVGHGARVEETTLEEWEWVVGVNLWGVVYMIHFLVPGMIERRQGAILITASAAGITPSPAMAPYNVTKGAMVSLGETLRMELATYNIGVSTLCPGVINTNIVRDGRIHFEGSEGAGSRLVEFYATKGTDPSIVAKAGIKVRIAFREMWTGRPGPVHIELPMPVVYGTGDEAKAPVLPPEQYRSSQPQPSEAQLEEAADLLGKAKRPLVVSGTGVDRAGANAGLMEVVELLNCPVFTTMAGRSTVPIDHPNHIYSFGGGGDVVKQESDVVLVAGSRLGNLDLPYDKYWGAAGSRKLIQIDIDPRNMGATRPLTLGIVADAKSALEGLARTLKARKAKPRDGKDLARYRQTSQVWWDEQFEMVKGWDGPGIHPAQATQAVGTVFGKDAIYCADGGNTSLWLHWFLPSTRPRSYHSILELGMLGTGIPYAIGAKLASPEREVVCVTGDGAAGFNFMEMQSAARENLNITTVVFAEGAWTMEEPNERMFYGRTFGTDMGTVRWDTVGEGLGCHGGYAEKIEDLVPALERAKEITGPAVVCVKTNRQANLDVPLAFLTRFVEVYQGPQG